MNGGAFVTSFRVETTNGDFVDAEIDNENLRISIPTVEDREDIKAVHISLSNDDVVLYPDISEFDNTIDTWSEQEQFQLTYNGKIYVYTAVMTGIKSATLGVTIMPNDEVW